MNMKTFLRIFAVVVLFATVSVSAVQAGNDDRRGTAGASELLINPWARSAGWGTSSIACVRGIDAFYSNIAGLSFTNKMDLAYSNTQLYGGKSGLMGAASINSFGLAVRVFDAGVMGVSVMAMSFGDIPVTTVYSPDAGKNGTFSPSYMNINVAYAHSFTRSVHGGVNLKVVTESTDNVSASGFAIDAGIQYVTGANDELKFGISLKNLGFGLKYSGAGLSYTHVNTVDNTVTAMHPSVDMEMPTCLNIGLSYDFLFDKWDQMLTVAGSFTSNAFLKDNFGLGVEYSLLNMFQLRCGYVFQKNIFSESDRTTANTGLCAGGSVKIPIGKKDKEGNGTSLSIDYSYRTASPLKGTHSIGASLNF